MTTPNRRGGEPPKSLGDVFAGLPAPWNGEWILKPPVDEANEVDLTAGPGGMSMGAGGTGGTGGSRPDGVDGVKSITTDRISGLNYRNRDVISALLGDTIPILSSWQVLSDALFNGLLSGFTSIENFIETIFKLVTGEEVDLSFLSDTARTILESFQTVITPIVEFIQWVWDNIGQDVLQAVLDLLAWVWGEFETLTGGNADDALRTLFTFLAWLFSEFGDSVESVLKPIFSTLKSLWVNVGQDSLDAVIDLISDLTQDLSLDLLGTLQRLAEFFQAIPDIQEWFDGIPGLDSIVEAVTQLPGGIDQLKRWAEQVPTIDQLVSKLTGTANATDLTQVGIWAKTLLDKTSSIPAANLVGTLPAAALGTIPVSAINISTPNLLAQGAFSAEKSVTGGNGWSWDAGVNRTGDGGSARVDCNGSVQELFSNQTVNATSDDRIELGAFIKTSSDFPSNGVIKVSVIKFNGSSPAGSSVANATVDLMTKTGGSTGWYELDSGQPWSVPEGVTSVRVRLSVQASAGSVWFDDVTLIKSGLLQQNLVEYLLEGWDGMWDAAFGSSGTFGKNIFDAVNAIGAISNRALLAANNATSSLNQILAMLSGSGKANAFDFGLALKNNIDGFTGFLNSLGKGDFVSAGAAVQQAVNDFGAFLYNAGQGTAATIGGLVNGAISGATQAVNDIGAIINNIGETITGGIVTTAQHVGQAINGAIQGTIDTWNNFWAGVFGTAPPGRTAANVLNAANKLKTDTGAAQATANAAKADNVLTNIAIYNGFFGYGGSGVVAETQATMAAIKTKLDSGYTLQTLTYNSGTKKQLIRVTDRPAGGVYQPLYKFTGGLTSGSGNVFPRVDCNATGPELAAVLQRSSTIGPGNADVTFFDRGYGNDYDVVLRPKVQNVAVSGTPTGGTFDLSFKGQTTAPIPYNASASDVQLALQNLSSTKASGSLALDGSGDFLGLPKVDLSQASSATIEFWFKLGSSGGGTVISNRISTTIDYEISVSATGASITYGMSNGTSSTFNYSFTAPVGQWHHLAIVITRSSNTAAFLGYFNGSGGSLLGINSNSPVTNANTSGCMAIGASDWNNPSSYFNGKISNLRIVRSRVYTGSSYTVPTSSLTNITGTALLMFRDTGFEDALGTQFAYNGNAVASTDSPFSSSLGNVTVTGSPGSYTVTFGNEIPNVELMTASSSLTGGTNPSVLVTDANSYEVIGVYPYLLYSGGPLPKVSTLSYWDKPWPSDDVPKEFYAVCFGSGGGGGAGGRRVSNSLSTSFYTSGGNGGSPGSYTAMELDASTIGPDVWYQVAGGGSPNSTSSAGSGAETTFGPWITTVAGSYNVIDLLGYYTSNGSSPGVGGTGGAGYSAAGNGVTGGTGGRSPLAAGGTGGKGSMVNGTTLTNIPSNGGVGADSNLTGKARAGGGGGGGGGGSWSQYANGSYLHTNPGGLGGNGGRPGGGGGGGGGAFTYDVNGVGAANIPNNGIAAGNGGYGGHGIIVLLWK